jgi:NAD(P)-dependent dehydrogenase (short-subunit alcohol dehydrogenase family)
MSIPPATDRDFPSRAGYALVTGGAARLGEAIVRRLASEGWRVAIHHLHSANEARALVRDLKREGCDAIAVACDLTNSANLPVMFAKANASLGFCSLLVNSAAIFEYDDIAGVTEESMDAHYTANLRAPVLLARHFADQLPKDAKGLIVNLLDQKVFNLNPDFLSYTIMKSALASATELLAMALAPRIRVCGVAPGLSLRSGNQTEKGFADAHGQTPLGFGSVPDDIAEAVSFIARVPSMTGSTVTVDGGQSLVRRSRDVMFSYGVAPDTPGTGKP